MGCEKLQKINEALKKELIESEIVSSTVRTAASKKKREQLKCMKGTIASEVNKGFPDGQRLFTLVTELETLSDAQTTRLDLLEEEATHFRTSYHSINKEYNRIKS